MATTNFVNGVTLSDAGWFNDVDALVYDVFNAKATAGTSGTILRSNGTNIVNTTATYPATATGTGTILRADGTNWIASTATYPTTATSSRVLIATGADAITDSTRITHDGTTHTVTGNSVISGSSVWGTGVANFGTVVKRKTADESVVASTALQNDDHLNITVAANEEWLGTFLLFVSTSAALNTMGFKIAITVPAASTMLFSCGDGFSDGSVAFVSSSGTALDFSTAETGTGVEHVMQFHFWVLNGANAGTIQLQWAQSTAANTITVKKGSFLTACRVA